MSRWWKLLLAAVLIVPLTAYAAGALTSGVDDPAPRATLLLPGAPATSEPEVVLTGLPEPSKRPTPSPAPAPAPAVPSRGDDGRDDCDDDDDDAAVDVIRPCPDDLAGDRDDDDDDRDEDGDDDDDDGDDDD